MCCCVCCCVNVLTFVVLRWCFLELNIIYCVDVDSLVCFCVFCAICYPIGMLTGGLQRLTTRTNIIQSIHIPVHQHKLLERSRQRQLSLKRLHFSLTPLNWVGKTFDRNASRDICLFFLCFFAKGLFCWVCVLAAPQIRASPILTRISTSTHQHRSKTSFFCLNLLVHLNSPILSKQQHHAST